MENRYDKYKDSGVEWIGEIPEHWEIVCLKRLSKISTGNQDTQDSTPDGKYPFFVRSPKVEKSNRYTFEGPSILMAGDGVGAGKIFHLADNKFACHQRVYCINQLSKINRIFLFYYLSSLFYNIIDSANSKSTVDSVRLPMLAEFPICIPLDIEQQTIAAYLDQKCGEIDELITLQEEMITKLQSYKQSVITEAVTKGLDKNVPLKDSGIEWIGMIPEHWEVKRLKNLGYLYGGLTGKTGNDFNVEEGDNYEYFIPFTNIFNNMYVDMNLLGKVKVSPNEKQNKVIKNDILFLMSSEDYDGIGKSSLCKENHPHPLYLNSFCKGLRVENKFKSIFLNYFMNSAVGKYFCQIASNGFIRINLRQDKLLACPILCPPLPEQQSIADYLDQRCSKIDEIISIKQQKIEKLKEYKKSLIFECVTGKRKVS